MDKWLTHNNFAKVIALVVSIILWAMVHLDSGTPVAPTTMVESRMIDNVKIQVTGFDEDQYVLYDIEPDKVNLEVKGKRTDLTSYVADYKVKVDLKNVGPGTISLPLTYELPPGVQLISMEPSIVKVTVEAKETKEIPVTITTTGEVDKGVQLGDPVVLGNGVVKVTLPSSEIDDLATVRGTVDVGGLKEPLKGKSVKLTAYDKQGFELNNAKIVPGSVEVDVPISKLYKSVPLEINQVGKLPEGSVLAGIETDVKGVAVYGPKDTLEGINSYPIIVDLSKLDGSPETKYTVDLTPPEGFEKIEPSSVQVTVKVENAGQKKIDGIKVMLKNENPDYNVRFVQPANRMLSITVLGAEEVIGSLDAEDVKVTIDLAGLKEGPHKIPAKITLPPYVTLVEKDKDTQIEIELTEQKTEETSTNADEPPGSSAANGDTNSPAEGENASNTQNE